MDELRNIAALEKGEVPHVLETTPKPFTAIILKLKYEGRARSLRIAWVNRAVPNFDPIYAGLHVPMGARVERLDPNSIRLTWQEIDQTKEVPLCQPSLWNGFATMHR